MKSKTEDEIESIAQDIIDKTECIFYRDELSVKEACTNIAAINTATLSIATGYFEDTKAAGVDNKIYIDLIDQCIAQLHLCWSAMKEKYEEVEEG